MNESLPAKEETSLDAGSTGVITGYLHQAADHPVRLNFPEGGYLKGLLVRVPE